MARSVTVDSRFNGPPGSGNGGYTCGLAAAEVMASWPATAGLSGAGRAAGPAVEVTLQKPPPLATPLDVAATSDTELTVSNGGTVILTARPAPEPAAVAGTAPVTLTRARQLVDAYDVDAYRAAHPFPTCFTCGPDRDPDDGLRIFPAPLAERGEFVACPWTPSASVAADDGLVAEPVMWAAIDCPSGMARFAHGAGEEGFASVLGRMTAIVHRRPEPGENLVAAGWTVVTKGRKTDAAGAVWSAEGELLAASATVWIALAPEQMAQFDVQR
jgi:hypothetical protein